MTTMNDLKIDFDNFKVEIKNGTPDLVEKVEAIRQWIVKFCLTEQDVNPIYKGTGFGTRIKSLYGRKRIGLGYEEAEVERDFREGLILCPDIAGVVDFKLSKEGKWLKVEIGVQLTDGEIINVLVDKVYKIRG